MNINIYQPDDSIYHNHVVIINHTNHWYPVEFPTLLFSDARLIDPFFFKAHEPKDEAQRGAGIQFLQRTQKTLSFSTEHFYDIYVYIYIYTYSQ